MHKQFLREADNFDKLVLVSKIDGKRLRRSLSPDVPNRWFDTVKAIKESRNWGGATSSNEETNQEEE